MDYILSILIAVGFVLAFSIVYDVIFCIINRRLKSTQKPPETPQADISVMDGRIYMSKQIMAKNHRITIN